MRPYRVEDAPALHESVMASLEHLRPWMPWIALEPQTVEQREARIVEWSETGEGYGLWLGDVHVGGCGLHDRIGPGMREIGYWVRAGFTGRGLATEAARRMVAVAWSLPDVDVVEIHHDKANVASGRVPAKLGFTLVREIPDEITAPGEIGISCEWRLRR